MSARAPEVDFAAAVQAALGPSPGLALIPAASTSCGFQRSAQSPGSSGIRVWVDAHDRAPEHYYGRAVRYFISDIRCKVLSAPNDLEGGWALARALRDALDTYAPVNYLLCVNDLCEEIGVNEQEQYVFAVNFTLTWVA